MNVFGKTFVVTGAGSGMGLELSRQLVEHGAIVAALDLRAAGLAKTAEAVGSRTDQLSTHVIDVSDRNAVERVRIEVLERHGQIDGLINNAGIIQPFVTIEHLTLEQIERVMNVNFYGTLYMIRAWLPHLKSRPEAHIVNISSMGGFLPVPGQAIYGASKAALKLMSEALYAELLETNVRVTTVFPGAVATHITENSGVQVPQTGIEETQHEALPADEAARLIIDGIEHDAFHVLVGSDAYLMDKLSRLMPERAVRIIQKQMKALLPED